MKLYQHECTNSVMRLQLMYEFRNVFPTHACVPTHYRALALVHEICTALEMVPAVLRALTMDLQAILLGRGHFTIKG